MYGVKKMAAWQVDSHLLPTSAILRRYGVVPINISSDDFNSTTWWNTNIDIESLATELSAIMPRLHSWSPNLQMWGEEDGNRVDLALKGGSIAEIFVRIDVRAVSISFLTGVIKLARKADLKFRMSNGRVLSPALRQLMEAIRGSPAFRYVEDPAGYLSMLEQAKHGEFD